MYYKQISLGQTTTCKISRVDNFNVASIVSVFLLINKEKHSVDYEFYQIRELFPLFYDYVLTDFSNIWYTDVKSTSEHFFFFMWYSTYNMLRDIQKKLIFYDFYTFFKGP